MKGLEMKLHKAQKEVTKQIRFIESQNYAYSDYAKAESVRKADFNELYRLQDIVKKLER
tara:strand:- start:112 stop:288 length:177 start_codon:yes stop_codon:yes gene_type:complete